MREPQLSISPPEEDEAFRERIIAGQSVQVKVIPPKESKQLTQYMPSRDDSKSPGQKFMRQSHSSGGEL